MFTAETVPASFVDRFVGLFYGSFGSHDWLAFSFRSSGSHHLFPVCFWFEALKPNERAEVYRRRIIKEDSDFRAICIDVSGWRVVTYNHVGLLEVFYL